MHFVYLVLVLCGLLVPCASPQAYMVWDHGPNGPCLEFAPENTLEWPDDPAFGTAAGFGRTVLADLDGDQSTDAVLVADGVPVVLWKVAVFDALEHIAFPTQPAPTDVRGIAALPGGGAGGRDALVLTDERGVYLVTYGSADFDDPQVLATGPWIDAAPIHADDVDGDADLDLIAIAADGRSLLTLIRSPSGFVPGLGVSLQRVTLDVVAVKWDGDALRELVTLNTRGLTIFNAAGVQVGSVLWPTGPGCIARFRTSAAPGELLAWSRVSGASTSELVVRNQTVSEGPWPLGFGFCGPYQAITPTAILSGNYDGNQDDELLLVHQGSETAVMLANKGAAPHFDPADPSALDMIPLEELLPAGPGGVGIPAFGQVDGMDSDDLVFPVERTERVEVFRRLPVPHALPSPGSMVVVSDHTEFGPNSSSPPANHQRLAFVVPSKYDNYLFVELTVWHQPGDGAPVELNAVYHRLHPLQESGGTVSPLTQWVDIDLSFPAFGAGGSCWEDSTFPTPPSKPNYYTELRFVKDPGTAVEKRSPVYTGGFTLRTCGTGQWSYDYLLQQGIQDKQFDLWRHNGLTSGLSEQLVGLYVPMSAQPPFTLNDNPSPGPRMVGDFAIPFTGE